MYEIEATPEYNYDRQRLLDRLAIVVTIAVLGLVGVMRIVKLNVGIDFSFIPPLNATLNSIVSILLILGLIAIKRGKRSLHQNYMAAAAVVSGLFLLCYVTYHLTTPETPYGGAGTMRTIYFFFLISHIVLAGLSLPFILLTFSRSLSGNFVAHKRMARWVFPLWLYVALTGPICYVMLRPYY